MTNDLFLKPPTKKQQLENFCRQKGYFSSHDINEWGTTHGLDSATRRIRELVPKKVKRLSDDEILFRGLYKKGHQHLAWYEWLVNSEKR